MYGNIKGLLCPKAYAFFRGLFYVRIHPSALFKFRSLIPRLLNLKQKCLKPYVLKVLNKFTYLHPSSKHIKHC